MRTYDYASIHIYIYRKTLIYSHVKSDACKRMYTCLIEYLNRSSCHHCPCAYTFSEAVLMCLSCFTPQLYVMSTHLMTLYDLHMFFVLLACNL